MIRVLDIPKESSWTRLIVKLCIPGHVRMALSAAFYKWQILTNEK